MSKLTDKMTERQGALLNELKTSSHLEHDRVGNEYHIHESMLLFIINKAWLDGFNFNSEECYAKVIEEVKSLCR